MRILLLFHHLGLEVMVFNATFNNISVILWHSVLVVEENRVPGENHRPVVSQWQTLSHNVLSSTHHLIRIRTHNFSGDRQTVKVAVNPTTIRFWLIFGVWRHFQQYSSYIMATSFSGGRSRSTWREPPTMAKQLVNFITCGCESNAPFLYVRL